MPQQSTIGRRPSETDWASTGYNEQELAVLNQYQATLDKDAGTFYGKAEGVRDDISKASAGVIDTQTKFNKYAADAEYHYQKYKERKEKYKDRWPHKDKSLRRAYRESRRLAAHNTGLAKGLSLDQYAPSQETAEYNPMMLEAMRNKFLPGSVEQANVTSGLGLGERFLPMQVPGSERNLRTAELERSKAYGGLIDAQAESRTNYDEAVTDLKKAQEGLRNI